MSELHGVSSFPLPPMQYISLCTDENMKLGCLSPPPIQENYTLFGAPFNVDDEIIQTMESQGLKRLYPLRYNCKREMKKLNHSILISFLDLIEILIRNPNSQKRIEKLDDINLLFINLHHLINNFRPNQAREGLRMMMMRQKKNRFSLLETFQTKISEAEELISKGIENLSDCNLMDCEALILAEKLGLEPIDWQNNSRGDFESTNLDYAIDTIGLQSNTSKIETELVTEESEPMECKKETPVENIEPMESKIETPVENIEPMECKIETPVENTELMESKKKTSVEDIEPMECKKETPEDKKESLVGDKKYMQYIKETPYDDRKPMDYKSIFSENLEQSKSVNSNRGLALEKCEEETVNRDLESMQSESITIDNSFKPKSPKSLKLNEISDPLERETAIQGNHLETYEKEYVVETKSIEILDKKISTSKILDNIGNKVEAYTEVIKSVEMKDILSVQSIEPVDTNDVFPGQSIEPMDINNVLSGQGIEPVDTKNVESPESFEPNEHCKAMSGPIYSKMIDSAVHLGPLDNKMEIFSENSEVNGTIGETLHKNLILNSVTKKEATSLDTLEPPEYNNEIHESFKSIENKPVMSSEFFESKKIEPVSFLEIVKDLKNQEVLPGQSKTSLDVVEDLVEDLTATATQSLQLTKSNTDISSECSKLAEDKVASSSDCLELMKESEDLDPIVDNERFVCLELKFHERKLVLSPKKLEHMEDETTKSGECLDDVERKDTKYVEVSESLESQQ